MKKTSSGNVTLLPGDFIELYSFAPTFKTRSYQRAIKVINTYLDDKSICRIHWREHFDDSIRSRSMCMRIWDAKNLLASLNRSSFISLYL